MQEEKAREIIAYSEDEKVEMKTAQHGFDISKLFSYISALSNESGGCLVLGVSNDRKIVGTSAFGDVANLKQKILTNGSISRRLRVVIYELELDGKRVVFFHIPPRPKGEPISYKGAYYMRSGESLVPMTIDQIDFIRSEHSNDYSADIIDGVGVEDLDPLAINRARQLWAAKSGLSRITEMSDKEVVAGLELADGRGVTLAAVILLGKVETIKRHVSNSELVWEYRKNEADIEFVSRKDYKQAFVLYFDDLWQQVDARNEVVHIRDGFLIRDIFAFGEEVVREAILNAIAHRDYQDSGSVYVRQSPERLVIESPGGFIHGVTADNIIDISSRPRNRRIAEAFQKLGLVERSGQGADKIFLQTIAAGKGLPSYRESTPQEVKLRVNAKIQDVDFIKYLEKITKETDVKLLPRDYILLEQVRQEVINSINEDDSLKRLLSLKLIEKSRHGRHAKPILSKRYYIAFNKRGEYTRQKGLSKIANLEIILKHLQIHRKGYARDIEQALPHVTRATINRYLSELAVQRKVELAGNPQAPSGKTRAYWKLKE